MMYVFTCTVFTIILYLILVFVDSKRNKKGEDVLALNLTPEEFYKALNFMLMYGVIDFTEYNKLEFKALSYLNVKGERKNV